MKAETTMTDKKIQRLTSTSSETKEIKNIISRKPTVIAEKVKRLSITYLHHIDY